MEQQAGGGLTRWEWWRGVAIAAVVVSLVVGVAELGQYLQTSLGFDKAYFLVYVNTTFVSSLLWIEFLRFLVLDRRQRRGQEEGRGRRGFLMLLGSGMEEDTPVNESNDEDVEVRKTLSSRKEKAEEEKSKLLPSSPQIQEEQAGDEGNDKTFRGAGAAFSALRGVWERFLAHVVAATDGVSLKRLALAAIPLTVFWWLANYCYTLSLPLTSVASILSIEQASTIFVYILSVIFLREKITLIKVMAVVVCIGGVVLIAFGDDEGSKHDSSSSSSASSSETKQKPLLGDIIVVFSAIGGACYMVFYKRVLCSGGGGGLGLPAVNVLLGCVGLCNALFAWPGLIIVNYTGWEPFVLPTSASIVRAVLAKAFLSVMYNYLLNYGIVVTSPLFMRIAIMCSVPASFLVQWILSREGHHHSGLNWIQLLGASLVLVGFVAFCVVSRPTSQQGGEEQTTTTTMTSGSMDKHEGNGGETDGEIVVAQDDK
ncbi:EamA domain-containing protein [Balamuthia mandrillaris]